MPIHDQHKARADRQRDEIWPRVGSYCLSQTTTTFTHESYSEMLKCRYKNVTAVYEISDPAICLCITGCAVAQALC